MAFLVHLKHRLLVPFAAAAALFIVSGPAEPASATAQSYASAQLLVKFRADATRTAIANAMGSAQVSEKLVIRDLGVHVLNVFPSRLDAALTALRRSPSVLYAERDALGHLMDTTPNDYWWPSEWSQTRVSAPRAWDLTRGSATVTVAILDTGVDPSQPDLQRAFVPGWNTLADNSDTSDTNGHGTLVAGVAAARSNNAIGIASYCWSCSLMPVKVLDTNAGTFSTVASGITWATDHGARIISMSLGFTSSSSTLQSAVQYAHNHNVVLIAAAGNYANSTPVYPAAYPEVLSVAGTDGNDQLYSWSDYGSWVKLAAPGCNFATGTSGWYGTFCGTSSAAPALAGIAGLAASYAPAASNTQLEQALESTAAPVGSAVQYGRADAYQAMLALGAASGGATGSAPVDSSAPTVTGTAQISETLTGSPGTWTGTAPLNYTYQWERCDSSGAACLAISGSSGPSYVLGSADVGMTIRLAVLASNAYGSTTAFSAPTALIAAAPAPSAPAQASVSFTGTLNAKQTAVTFPLVIGSGVVQASLAFSKWPSLTLTVRAADGTIVGSANGGSVLTLVKSLSAGSYAFNVAGTGKGGSSFTLTVSYPPAT
jgi:subtilisin family serine protease